jgi:hypothetical protein
MANPPHRPPAPRHRHRQRLSSQRYRAPAHRAKALPRGCALCHRRPRVCCQHLVVAAQMRLRTFRVILVVNRSPSAKSPGVVRRPHRSAARVKATGPLLPAIAGCRVAMAAPAEPPGDASRRLRGRLTADATLPVSARQRLPWPRPYYRDGYPAAAYLPGHAQSGPGAVAAPLELEQARAGSTGGRPCRERTYLGSPCSLSRVLSAFPVLRSESGIPTHCQLETMIRSHRLSDRLPTVLCASVRTAMR